MNIMLNKRLVEKNGYDIKDIKKKYRPFINKEKIVQKEDNNQSEEINDEEEKNGNE